MLLITDDLLDLFGGFIQQYPFNPSLNFCVCKIWMKCISHYDVLFAYLSSLNCKERGGESFSLNPSIIKVEKIIANVGTCYV